MGIGRVFGRHQRLLGEKRTPGESIAQRSQRSQRGDRDWSGLWATPAASGRETRARGKASHRGHGGHRGGWAVARVFFGRHRRLLGEKHALGESIAQRSRRSQRGMGCGRRHICFFPRRHALRRPADPFLPARALWWTPWLSCTKNSYSCQTATVAD
jgi:hypothetical protein